MSAGRGRTVAANLAGVIESSQVGSTPYRVDETGRPYVPIGDGGVVLGPRLGDGVTAFDGDHLAAGVTLAHPDQAARFALTAFACIGNTARITSGDAAGAVGTVIGQRGEEGRVLVLLDQEVLAAVQPGDGVSVRAHGQGAVLPDAPDGVAMLNLDPALVAPLGIGVTGGRVSVEVRAVLPSRYAGNGIGRPGEMWDVDLAIPSGPELESLRLGDLVAVTDLDVRHDMGFRRGWMTIGVVVHGTSPMPGHGPGITPVLTGPAAAFDAEVVTDRPAALAAALESVGSRRSAVAEAAG